MNDYSDEEILPTSPSTKEKFNYRDFKSVKKRIRIDVIKEYQSNEKKRVKKEREEKGKSAQEVLAHAKKKYKKRKPLKRKRSFVDC